MIVTKLKTLNLRLNFQILFFLSFTFTLSAQQDCELSDKIEVVNVLDKNNSLEISEDLIYGIDNSKLEVKSSLNGNQNTTEALDSLLLTLISEDIFRSDQYKIFEASFVITTKSEVTNLFLTSEIFWFLSNDGGTTQYQELEGKAMEIEMAKSIMGYIELDKIKEIKALIASQNWKPGMCNGKAVNTLITITLNDI